MIELQVMGLGKKDYFLSLSTAQKMKFCIKDFFSKCDQIRNFFMVPQKDLRRPLRPSKNL